MVGTIPTPNDAPVELSIEVQGFLDQFERLNRPVGCDIGESQLREQIEEMNTLRTQVNTWGQDFLSRHDLADALVETTDLVIAIESAIDDRYTILFGS